MPTYRPSIKTYRALVARVVAVAIAVLSIGLNGWASTNPDAVAYQINPAHDGAITFSNFSATPQKLWSVKLPGAISYPLIANGEVYITTGDGNTRNMALDAFNGATGNLDWSISFTPTYYANMAAYENGSVFVTNSVVNSNTMKAYNATTGALQWDAPLAGLLVDSAPTALNGMVYVGGSSGDTVNALRESDGKRLWNAPVSSGLNSSAAVTATGVYVSYNGPQTYAFDPASGALKWHYNGQAIGGGGRTPVYYNGNVYVRDPTFHIFGAFDATTGTQLAAFSPSFSPTSVPAFSNGIGYVPATTSSNANALEAFDPVTGAVIWSHSLGGDNFVSAPIVINNIVFEATSSGNIYEFDGANGQQIGVTNVGQGIAGPDEQSAAALTGLSAGDGLLAVPSQGTLQTMLTVYSVTVPEPSTLAAAALGLSWLLSRRTGRSA
jgi:outer membrane protein assembly factor BamB